MITIIRISVEYKEDDLRAITQEPDKPCRNILLDEVEAALQELDVVIKNKEVYNYEN